jgi:hypothetical protein
MGVIYNSLSKSWGRSELKPPHSHCHSLSISNCRKAPRKMQRDRYLDKTGDWTRTHALGLHGEYFGHRRAFRVLILPCFLRFAPCASAGQCRSILSLFRHCR